MSEKKSHNRDPIFVFNSECSLRIDPGLAEEIGLNESIMLLQLEFLIRIAGEDNYKDGRRWTYQSLRDLRDSYFCWWSLDTISRTLKRLEAGNFILIGNYNRRRNDKTQWFALNYDQLARLKSISITPHQPGPAAVRISDRASEKRTGVSEIAAEVSENQAKESESQTTLPESPESPETTPDSRVRPPRNLMPSSPAAESATETHNKTPQETKAGTGGPAPPNAHQAMFATLARACRWEIKFLTKKRRGQLNNISKQLREQAITPAQVERWLELWYAQDWRGQKGQPPDNPQVILDNWAKFRERAGIGSQGFAEASYQTPELYDQWGNRL